MSLHLNRENPSVIRKLDLHGFEKKIFVLRPAVSVVADDGVAAPGEVTADLMTEAPRYDALECIRF